MLRIPFWPEKMPYRVRSKLGGRQVVLVFEMNQVLRVPMLSILLDGELVWRRPLLYGVNALFGNTMAGLEEVGLLPLVPNVGLGGVNRDVSAGKAVLYLLEEAWRGHSVEATYQGHPWGS